MRPRISSRAARRTGLVALVLLLGAAAFFSVSREADDRSDLARPTRAIAPAATLSTTSTVPVFAGREPWQEPVARSGIDASNFYKNAFVLYAQLTEEEKKMISKPSEEVDAEAAAALFAKIQPIMELLRQAAAADYCDWGLEAAFETPMTHLSQAQAIAQVALWNAAFRFEKEPEGAVDDLLARAKLGHDVSDLLIGLIVEASIEKGALDLLRVHAGRLEGGAWEKVQTLLREPWLEKDFASGLASETALVLAQARKLAAMSSEERIAYYAKFEPREIVPASAEERAQAERRKEEVLRDFRKLSEYLANLHRQTAEAMQWPEARFAEWRKRMEREIAEQHPGVADTFRVVVGVRDRFQQMRVQRTMLDAGLHVLRDGPEQLANFRDPANDAPLIYTAQENGFTLNSTYQVKGKPISMSFLR